jgi:glycosyltransferase involved in cell wall biosynthesis
MKTALVHDWLTGMRGGEKCLEVLCELHPDADLFTLVHVPGSVSETIENRRIITSPLQKIPGARRWYRFLLPLMPTAIESLDLSAYDLVISTSHCVAKGVLTRPEALHICYVHTPMRYVWDLWPQYFRHPSYRLMLSPLLHYLRTWDMASAARVDRFVANSSFVARRVRKYYRRRATVVHPPVDTAFFHSDGDRRDYFLMVAAMVPYKGVDLAVRAFNALRLPLRIVGEGHLRRKFEALAGPTIEFTGRISDEALRECYAGCRAVLLPGAEDFGIVPLEANSAGRPVIALGRAGALDTVVPINSRASLMSRAGFRPSELSPEPTGVFFYDYSVEGLEADVRFFQENEHTFEPEALRRHARRFDRSIYKQRMQALISEALEGREADAEKFEEMVGVKQRRFAGNRS